MSEISVPSITYFYACHFLWSILSLFLYLDEEITNGNMGRIGSKWSSLSDHLANWLIEEWHRPLDNSNLVEQEKDKMLLVAEKLDNSLMFHFADAINKVSENSAINVILPDESRRMYICYCRFLLYVLDKFDQVMRELEENMDYYEHYHKNIDLFNDLRIAIDNENSFLDLFGNKESGGAHTFGIEIDNFVTKLATEWHQAVLEAAHRQQLPDFVKKDM